MDFDNLLPQSPSSFTTPLDLFLRWRQFEDELKNEASNCDLAVPNIRFTPSPLQPASPFSVAPPSLGISPSPFAVTFAANGMKGPIRVESTLSSDSFIEDDERGDLSSEYTGGDTEDDESVSDEEDEWEEESDDPDDPDDDDYIDPTIRKIAQTPVIVAAAAPSAPPALSVAKKGQKRDRDEFEEYSDTRCFFCSGWRQTRKNRIDVGRLGVMKQLYRKAGAIFETINDRAQTCSRTEVVVSREMEMSGRSSRPTHSCRSIWMESLGLPHTTKLDHTIGHLPRRRLAEYFEQAARGTVPLSHQSCRYGINLLLRKIEAARAEGRLKM